MVSNMLLLVGFFFKVVTLLGKALLHSVSLNFYFPFYSCQSARLSNDEYFNIKQKVAPNIIFTHNFLFFLQIFYFTLM